MNKIKANKLLKEILEAWTEKTPVQAYNVDGSDENSYEIKIVMPSALSENGRKLIESIADQNGLAAKQMKGYFVLYEPKNDS